MQEPRWTLDELAERVDAALAVDYQGPPSGRVRAVPDRRAIRWYTTIGLVDRPVAHRGRTALYGPRHLLQLVAVKRLQATGMPLVAIQRELAGATDTQLAGVARIPAGGRSPVPVERPAAAPRVGPGGARRASFWRDRPGPAALFGAESPRALAADLTDPTDPVDPVDPVDLADPTDPGRPTGIRSRGPATLRGVRLGDGATLLLEPGRELAVADLDAILDAARPLLAALRERGLAGPDEHPVRRPEDGRGNEPRREHP
jgi:DNA-binding transcriptional MerR regulator